MSLISSYSHIRRVGIISTTTVIAIGKKRENSICILLLIITPNENSFSGLAFLFWKKYNRSTQVRRPNQIQNRPPLTKTVSVDGSFF